MHSRSHHLQVWDDVGSVITVQSGMGSVLRPYNFSTETEILVHPSQSHCQDITLAQLVDFETAVHFLEKQDMNCS